MTRVYGAETADRETGADRRYLADVVGIIQGDGLRRLVGPAPRHRTPPAQLVGQLKRDPVDLLVVGSHGHGLVRDLLYGQTVDKVRHGLDIPMLIARPDRNQAVSEQPVEVVAGLPS